MATKMTLKVVDMCITAAQSSHFFGQEVELFGLKNEAMNGKCGIGRGFYHDTRCQSVYLFDDKKQVAVLPENVWFFGEKHTPQKSPNLVDVQDQLGLVCLHGIAMANCLDVGKFLLEKHKAKINIEDCTGFSPERMALSVGKHMSHEVAALILDARKNNEEVEMNQIKCANCQAPEAVQCHLQACAYCKVVYYCSRKCQKEHGKRGNHKAFCFYEEPVVLWLMASTKAEFFLKGCICPVTKIWVTIECSSGALWLGIGLWAIISPMEASADGCQTHWSNQRLPPHYKGLIFLCSYFKKLLLA